MLTVCRQYYRGNHSVLKMIDKFEKEYHADDCISWFTRETFIYRLINEALRRQDVEQLFIFRFYITDLSKKLLLEHKKMFSQSKEMICLYRGALITKVEVQTIENNQEKLIATNCYWSTSRDRSYAMTFAKKYKRQPDMISVLLQIKCSLNDDNNSTIFADISNLSYFSREREVLFDLGATFTIEDIHEETVDDTNLLIITVVTNGKGREISQKYLNKNREEMEFESPTILLCNLLRRMGKEQQSLEFLQYLMKNPGDENLAHILTRIGIILKDDGKYQQALEHFQIALQWTINVANSSQQKYLPVIFLNQGLVYAKIRQYDRALHLYGQAQELLKNKFYSNDYVLAHVFSSMGRIYSYQGCFSKALHYFFKSSGINEKILPPDHPFLAHYYTDMANIYSRQSKYDEAVKYQLRALEIRKKTLSDNHYQVAWSLYQLGRLYQWMSNSQLALQYYLQSLEIYRQYQSSSLLTETLQLLDAIIFVYDAQVELSLEYQLEASNIQRKIEPINYFSLANRLSKIASAYKSMNNVDDSIRYNREAAEIRRRYQSQNSSNLTCEFRSYNNLFISSFRIFIDQIQRHL